MENTAVQVPNTQIADFTRFRRCLEDGYDEQEARRLAMGEEPEVRIVPDPEEREQEERLKRALRAEHRRMRQDDYNAWANSPEGRQIRRRENLNWFLDVCASIGVAVMTLAFILQIL